MAAHLPIDRVNLPFLGARKDTHALFQYLLTAETEEGVSIFLPSWLALRESLGAGDAVALHLPFRLRSDAFDEGTVTAAEADAEQGGQKFSVALSGDSPLKFPIYVEATPEAIVFREVDGGLADPLELLRWLMRDFTLTKSGIRVYFKHLVPLFSRITLFPTEEYAELRKVVLEEVRGRILTNIQFFAEWQKRVEAADFSLADIAEELDLEKIREAVEPEINNELFGTVFDPEPIRQYLDAMRLLERKLCLNYNTLVLLYASFLEEAVTA